MTCVIAEWSSLFISTFLVHLQMLALPCQTRWDVLEKTHRSLMLLSVLMYLKSALSLPSLSLSG